MEKRTLAEMAALYKPGTQVPIVIRRGVRGYTTAPHLKDPAKMAKFNDRIGATARDQAALWGGYEHGFNTRYADPSSYTIDGEYKPLPDAGAEIIPFPENTPTA